VKQLFFLALMLPLATVCMENEEESYFMEDNKRVISFRQKFGARGKITELEDRALSILNHYEDPAIVRPLLQRLKLKPEANWRSLFAEWAVIYMRESRKLGHDNRNVPLLIEMGANFHYQGPHTLYHLLHHAIGFNALLSTEAILTRIKKPYYPVRKLARGRKNIFTLFCCVHKSGIRVPKDIKGLLIDTCAAQLLAPPQERIAQLEDVLGPDINGVYGTPYNLAKVCNPDGLDPELLNPEKVRAQYEQTYRDNCARFRKTIFKKEEELP
jgi:hypothetical protein